MNAELLSALLLLAVSFWATVVWLLVDGRVKGTFRSLGIDERLRWSLSALEARPLLGVFRLWGCPCAHAHLTGGSSPANAEREGESECPADRSPRAKR